MNQKTMRTGTKTALFFIVWNCILVTWLVVGLPLLCIWFPHLVPFRNNISLIIAALTGGSGWVHWSTEKRKRVENTYGHKKEYIQDNED